MQSVLVTSSGTTGIGNPLSGQLANRLITALQIGLAAPAAWDIPNTLFPFSFNAVFTTQCVAVLAWL